MRLTRIFIHRLRSVFLQGRIEHDLERELELHIEQLTMQYVAEGMSLPDARSAARREFGSLDSTKEQCRDTRNLNWWEDFVRDCRHAMRSLLRAPAFASAAVLTIALGIGVNTAVFSVIHTVLLDPLPFREPDRLVHISATHPDFPSLQAAAPDFLDWRRMTSSFDTVAAYTFQAMNKWAILGDGDPEPVQVVQASYELFGMLGIEPLLGRAYTAEEEAKKLPVILLSESLWRRKYGADPAIIGRTIRLVGWPVTVVGIVPHRQAEPRWTDVWMPLSFLDPALTETRRFRPLEVIGRLKPGITIEQAQAEMSSIAGALEQAHPDTNGKIGTVVRPLAMWTTRQVRPALLIAWAAASLVLLLACANVAHLVLIRTVHRAREMAVRAALGAGSARLTRFLLADICLPGSVRVRGCRNADMRGALRFPGDLPLPEARSASDHQTKHGLVTYAPPLPVWSLYHRRRNRLGFRRSYRSGASIFELHRAAERRDRFRFSRGACGGRCGGARLETVMGDLRATICAFLARYPRSDYRRCG